MLPGKATDADEGRKIAEQLCECIEPKARGAGVSPAQPPGLLHHKKAKPLLSSLTYDRTAKRSYEKAYWQTIVELSTGPFRNKDNADCVLDPQTQEHLDHHQRDLEALGDYLLAYYSHRIDAAGMTGQALAGELPFRWQTDFHFPWSGGWSGTRTKRPTSATW